MFRSADLPLMFFKPFTGRLNFHREFEITWMPCSLMMYVRYASLQFRRVSSHLSTAEGCGVKAAVPLAILGGQCCAMRPTSKARPAGKRRDFSARW